ncbi:hypothetical protein M758_10G112100 [Ceratodon purpureus]|nr:hypothetical protein M758_10G112100 [Ceratodon purpureus]
MFTHCSMIVPYRQKRIKENSIEFWKFLGYGEPDYLFCENLLWMTFTQFGILHPTCVHAPTAVFSFQGDGQGH